MPITIEPWSHGRSAIFESYRRNGFAIVFKLAPAGLPQNEHFPDPVDLTKVRVEARAVAEAKRPGPAVEPTVLEHVPGAKRPRRAQSGLVKIVRRKGGPEWGILPEDDGRETVEIFVATPPGVARRGVSVTLTQGTRRLGSFAAAGRCYTERMRAPYQRAQHDLRLQGQARLALGPVLADPRKGPLPRLPRKASRAVRPSRPAEPRRAAHL